MNLKDSAKCSFCDTEDETIDHLFWKCPKTQAFINDMKNKFQEMSLSLNLDEQTFILGILPKNTPNITQFLILIAKYYISMNRSTNRPLNFLEYKINVQSLFQSHKEIAFQNNKMMEFLQAWTPFNDLLN